MKIRILAASVGAVLAAWAPIGSAQQEVVTLNGEVGPAGELNGVRTIGIGILDVRNNQNINTNNDPGGAFTTSANNQGDIRFAGNSTVTGDTGDSGVNYLNLSGGAAGTTVNFNGDVYSTIITVSGAGTLNFNGNVTGAPVFANDGFINLGAGRSLTGAITTNTANTGTLTLNGGSSVTGAIGGASGLKQINVVGGNAVVTGAVQAQGFSLGANTLTVTGALTTNAGGTIATTLLSDAVFGKIVVGTSNIDGGGITVIPTVTGVLTNNTNFRIVEAAAGPNAVVVNVVNNNPRYTFAGVPTTTGDVNILLTGVAPLATLVAAPAAAAVAPVLEVIAPVNTDLRAIQDAIAVLPSAAAIDSALVQLAPGTGNLAAPRVAGQTARLFDDLWMARLDEVHNACCDTSCEPKNAAAPVRTNDCKDAARQGKWWAKGFGNFGSQGDQDNLNGYDTEAFGMMLAYDRALNHHTRVGFGAGYANTSVDGNHSSGKAKIDSYQLTGYFSHAPGPWFVNGAVTAGMDKYDGSRSIVFPGVNRKASADYDGQQYSAMVAAGKHLMVDNAITVTPIASLRATRVHVDGYTETGAGDLNLRVKSQSYDFLQSTLGVKAERTMQSARGNFYPEVHFNWMHDFNSTAMEQDASFAGGGRFTTEGVKQDRDLFNVGAGVSFLSCNCGGNAWTIKGLYDYKWNQSSYDAHQVSVVASLRF